MKERTTFADRLRFLREREGISPYRLAQLSGISKQALYRLEAGDTQPAWETVQRLAKALGVDYQELADPNLEIPAPQTPERSRGRPPKATPATPPAEDLEATAKKTRGRQQRRK